METTGRFAPSPSGRLHLGNLLCALLVWLSARQKNGRVLLRVEDLDTARCPRRYAEQMEKDLQKLTDESSKKIDELLARKEKELMEI